MTVVGKAVTMSFFGKSPKYSYFNGCSNGGREGLMEAQRYCDDYNGILADTPAVYWKIFIAEAQWSFVVLNNEGYNPFQYLEDPVTTTGNNLWFGILPGANFSTVAITTTNPNGTNSAVAFEISDSWYRSFLFKEVNYNTANITYAEFGRLSTKAIKSSTRLWAQLNPDLSAFKARGGKMISWHGLADNLVMPNGTMQYSTM
ncbi:hypothetical protein MMC18_009063 [Xylographa bjoerkii]|nr:hypothetical protein [Xylographa bjoerkii]